MGGRGGGVLMFRPKITSHFFIVTAYFVNGFRRRPYRFSKGKWKGRIEPNQISRERVYTIAPNVRKYISIGGLPTVGTVFSHHPRRGGRVFLVMAKIWHLAYSSFPRMVSLKFNLPICWERIILLLLPYFLLLGSCVFIPAVAAIALIRCASPKQSPRRTRALTHT